MTSVPRVPAATTSAVEGIRRGMERLDRSAAEVAVAGPAASNAAVLEISDQARAQASQAHGAGLEEALIDGQLASHQVKANIRSLQTADEMSRDLIDLLGR